jgi:mRNA interferase MazF
MSCSRSDVVLLPIPFTDLSSSKVRPAIVVGLGSFPGDIFVVPVTSQSSNWDVPLKDWQAAGLNVASGVKAQLATVHDSLVRKVVGQISAGDRSALDQQLRLWLGL